MPTITQARVTAKTGEITFKASETSLESSGSASSSSASGVSTSTGQTGLTLAGPTGPSGPPGPQGPSGVVILAASTSLTLATSIGASAFATLVSTVDNLVCVEITATTLGPTQNYILALYDGAVGNNLLLYQATGITATSYLDKAPFYIPAPTSGVIVAAATNIDADATTISLSLKYFLA